MHVPIFSAHAWFGRNSCFERIVNGAGTVAKRVTVLGFCSANAVLGLLQVEQYTQVTEFLYGWKA